MKPLNGIRVVACEQVLAGPYCTMLLADMGAEVIKIEPLRGDVARQYPPTTAGEDGGEISLYFSSLNRDKRSLAVDLKASAGRELALGLIEKSDVLVSNLKPGAMDRLGLDYKTCGSKNPSLVYATISGFGSPDVGGASPYWSLPAYDIIAQASGGIMSVTGDEGSGPVRVGVSIGDITAGIFAAMGVVGALFQREKYGRGQRVDVSMTDAVIALLTNAVACSAGGMYGGPIGSRHPSLAPFDSFEANDGRVVIAAGSDSTWNALCRAIGREDLSSDPRFLNNELRLKNHRVLKDIIEQWTRLHSRRAIIDALATEGCPASSVNTVYDLLVDPHAAQRDMIREFGFDGVKMYAVGNPIKLGNESRADYQAPPRLGQDTSHILGTLLGLSDEEIFDLRSRDIIR